MLGRGLQLHQWGWKNANYKSHSKAIQGVAAGRWEGLVTLTSARSQWDGDGESNWTGLVFLTLFVIRQVEERGEQKQSKGLGDVFSQEQVWDCDFGENV